MSDSERNVPLPEGEAASPPEPAPAPPPGLILEPAPASLVPEDLRVPWTWTDVFIFMIFAIGGIIVLEYTLQTVLLSTGRVSMKNLPAFIGHSTVYVAVRQFLWFMMLLGFLSYTLRPRRATSFWHTIGWQRPLIESLSNFTLYLMCLFSGAVLAIVIATLSSWMAPKQPLPIQAFFLDQQSIYLMAVMAVLIAPIVEETVFRGFLYPVFARTLGITGGVALTGILFGLMHAQQLWGGWAQIALLVVVGLVFTATRARTGSVIPCYLLHLGYNAIQFAGFFFSDAFHKLPLVK